MRFLMPDRPSCHLKVGALPEFGTLRGYRHLFAHASWVTCGSSQPATVGWSSILQYFSSQISMGLVLAAGAYSGHQLMVLVVNSSGDWTRC